MAIYTCRAVSEDLDSLIVFIEKNLDEMDCPVKNRIQIDVAADEIFANVVNYAYQKEGDVSVEILPALQRKGAKIVFRDTGVPFNPLTVPIPDLTPSADDRKIGGLGIFMVRQSMDKVEYEHTDGQNCFTITKYFD